MTQLTPEKQQIEDLQDLSREYERNAALRMSTTLSNSSGDTDSEQPEPWINEPIPVAARERRPPPPVGVRDRRADFYPRRRGG